ncbi:peptide-methionine (S)-S-oxide reductase MsrA [Dehalogenimonas alkenigignens]|uniref:Peptide methionine sulfoxide reductase MsrA n=1 Tax=Dehalogenimonas alkenigignens TaxID=1217799 RepID=A0A0W0GJS9_9CHLR|nr:peptide-methionine (S)-S-oxide reductase MsrA [Dehalogenimonas alkenigignens]KTB48792.1 methionine-S-sulfoxide reductase [Dehalogenimonas alkenigignens]PVV84796.1 peptide-methionine (S)-S-oxide reductase [Dehalogenimonas alkenigignens]
MESAVFGGGCFWCLEAVFSRLKGVTGVTPGYAGGTVEKPTYEQVCSGRTGHAEVVRIEYDESVITFRDLLAVFFRAHDPTTANRQGADIGSQYRSIILTADQSKENEARAYIEKLETAGEFQDPIVTEIQKLNVFYPAETYHHDYYRRHSDQPYCRAVIAPKLAKLFKDK